MTDSPLKRKRSRIACEPCRDRKRRCDGAQPCDSCLRFEYECQYKNYSGHSKKARHSHEQPLLSAPTKLESLPPPSLEANSGATFARQLALKIDPQNAPRLNLFSWNIGERYSNTRSKRVSTLSTEDISSAGIVDELSAFYFEKVDICYNFIDRAKFFQRWKVRQLVKNERKPFDAVLFGVTALGSLFSNRVAPALELQLVESARSILDEYSGETPTTETITGQLLRVVYLRMTASPHVAWMSSCTLMHMVEAAGLHIPATTNDPSIQPVVDGSSELRWRLLGVAQHLNTWISFDLGRSRVVLQGGVPSVLPYLNHQDSTKELLSLLPMSEALDPSNLQNASNLESAFVQVLDSSHIQPPSVMAQCNLMLCIYRRLRALNLTVSPETLDRALTLMSKGLRCAREMVRTNCPWHHMANVPFQIICTLLAIDNRSALSRLGDAMKTLGEVSTAYDTSVMREAYKTARLLVFLSQRRKEDDAKMLSEVMKADPLPPVDPTMDRSSSQALQDTGYGDSWLESLLADIPGLEDIESQFSMTNMLWTFQGSNA
ncbi:putative c6 transcription protein [Botrytis fragariae]|uniref:Putative c6 transcription protein n=1 Tax=Botrytis fragariae TaxID=1964551 RepID=A0A8H6EE20_9HELO|nr:putative c6 transcription protein [Botrytis fragariae]KAF5868500.1 putative c6 transcription protein [Botrytis fragariae]